MSTANGTKAEMVVHTEPAKSDASRAFEPRNIAEGFRLAEILSESMLLPKHASRPAAAFAIIAAGRELGLTAMQSLRSIHIIEGKPTLSADLIVALCKSRSDVCEWFRLVESSDRVATYETQRRGEPVPTKMSFSIEDAQRAALTGKDNWKKYPAAMLRARAAASLARAVYPDLAMGVYDPDELAEVAPRQASAGEYEVATARQHVHDSRPEAVSDPEVLADIHDMIDSAEAKPALNRVAAVVKKAKAEGKITDADYQAIAKATNKKAAILGERPSQPKNDVASDDREPGEEG